MALGLFGKGVRFLYGVLILDSILFVDFERKRSFGG